MPKHKEWASYYATFRKTDNGWKVVLHPAPVEGERWFFVKIPIPDELIGEVIEASTLGRTEQ